MLVMGNLTVSMAILNSYIEVKVPGAENTFERDRVDGADPRKKFGPNLSKKSKSDKLE